MEGGGGRRIKEGVEELPWDDCTRNVRTRGGMQAASRVYSLIRNLGGLVSGLKMVSIIRREP